MWFHAKSAAATGFDRGFYPAAALHTHEVCVPPLNLLVWYAPDKGSHSQKNKGHGLEPPWCLCVCTCQRHIVKIRHRIWEMKNACDRCLKFIRSKATPHTSVCIIRVGKHMFVRGFGNVHTNVLRPGFCISCVTVFCDVSLSSSLPSMCTERRGWQSGGPWRPRSWLQKGCGARRCSG